MYKPGIVRDGMTWPLNSLRTVGVVPSPQSIVTVYELSASGSVNWPSSAIVSPSLAVVFDKPRSAAVN